MRRQTLVFCDWRAELAKEQAPELTLGGLPCQGQDLVGKEWEVGSWVDILRH